MQYLESATYKQSWHPTSTLYLWSKHQSALCATQTHNWLRHDIEGQVVRWGPIPSSGFWLKPWDIDRITWPLTPDWQDGQSQSKCVARHKLPADPPALFCILGRDSSLLPLSHLNLHSILCQMEISPHGLISPWVGCVNQAEGLIDRCYRGWISLLQPIWAFLSDCGDYRSSCYLLRLQPVVFQEDGVPHLWLSYLLHF